MPKGKPKSLNPQPPAGNAVAPETSQTRRPDKQVQQPASSQSEENAGSNGISTEERTRMIEEAAYYCAQRRQAGGNAGTAEDDWAEAEAQIERLLQERNQGRE